MNTHCSPTLLESALSGNLPPADESALQRHLESCPQCSAALERLAGGTEWCREAAALLADDELDAAVPAREEWSDVDFTVEHLEPSHEPNVLGQLGGYDVLEVIGRGGMSVVLKGYDRELKRCVAIKVLAPHLAQSSLAKKRFAREAQAAAAVVHPHVLAIHQVQAGGRLPFLVMPLVSGETLGARLAAEGTLELKEILRIGMQAAAGLAAAHEQGLVHRDVKPANILLEKGVERAVLTDFGLARAGDDVTLTRWGIIAGTPEYMSPEQARGEPLDGRSDLFSLGCVLYQMATGVSPFRADSVIATMRRLVDEPPRSPASLNPELPPWFIAIVDRLLHKDPAQRFGSAREVSELLEDCLAHVQQPSTAPLPSSLLAHAARRRSVFTSHRTGMIAMLAASGITLLGLSLWQVSQTPDNTSQPSTSDASPANTGPSRTETMKPTMQPGWGDPLTGVRIRANVARQQWPADEPVEVTVDLNNEIGGQLGMARVPYCEVEIEGAWYIPALSEQLVAGAYVVGQGIHDRVAVVQLSRDKWVLKSAVNGDIQTDARAFHRALLLASADPANQLTLAPGRHTIRIACAVDGRASLPVSQPVEVEVVAAGKETPAAGGDPLGVVAPEARGPILTAEQAVAQGQELYHRRKQVTVRFRVGIINPRTVLDEDGKSSEWWHLHAESAPDFSASLSPQAQAALGGNGIAEAERRFAGKLVDVTGTVTGVGLDLISRPDTIWTFQVDVTSLDQVRLVDAANARGESGAAADGQPDDSHTAVEAPGIHVKLLLKVETHSRELMNRNVGFDGISLMGTGVRGTVDGKESDNFVAVLAHNCRLESFAAGESADGKYWRATFFVPQGPTSDGSNRSLSQARLDAMQAEGVQFALDHTRDQAAVTPDRPHSKAEPITPTRLNYFTTGHGIAVACSADGRLIAVANGNPTRILQVGGTSRVKGNWRPTADILDGETGQIVASLKLTTAEEDTVLAATVWITHFEVTALAFSPADNLVAVGTSIGQVKLYHVRTGELVRSLDDEPAKLADQKAPENWRSLPRAIGSVASLAFSHDGTLLAVCGGSFDDFPGVLDGVTRFTRKITAPGRVKVFDVRTGALQHDLVGHSYANTVAFSPDGTLLASAGSWLGPGGDDHGAGVILWDPRTGERMRTITSEANVGTQAVVFSPDSRMIVCGADQYDKKNATTVSAIGMTYVLSGITEWVQMVPGGGIPKGYSLDGSNVLVLCEKSIRFLNSQTGAVEREVTSTDLSADGRWNDIAIAPQAGRLVIGSVDEEEGNVALWNVAEPAAAAAGSDAMSAPATDAP